MIILANTNKEQYHSPWKINTASTAKQSFVKHLTLPWQFTAHSEGVIVLSKVLCIKQNPVQLIPAAAFRQLVVNKAKAVFSGCPFQGSSASPGVRVITTSHLVPAVSLNYLMLSLLLYWNIITMWPTNGALRDEGNLGNWRRDWS